MFPAMRSTRLAISDCFNRFRRGRNKWRSNTGYRGPNLNRERHSIDRGRLIVFEVVFGFQCDGGGQAGANHGRCTFRGTVLSRFRSYRFHFLANTPQWLRRRHPVSPSSFDLHS